MRKVVVRKGIPKENGRKPRLRVCMHPDRKVPNLYCAMPLPCIYHDNQQEK